MVAHKSLEPGVYRFFALIDGRPAFFYIDWRGAEHPLRVVERYETEEEVVAELEAAMGPRPSRRSPSFPNGRPPLFLV